MQAVRAVNRSDKFELGNVPMPAVGAHDVLVKIEVSSITPGMRTLVKMGLCELPSTLGHEGAGTIVAVGRDVPGISIGDRVRVRPILSCLTCPRCTSGREHMCVEGACIGFARFGKKTPLYDQYPDGCLAEYVRLPYSFIDLLPPQVSFDAAAKVHDVATALQLLNLANIPDAATVLITAPTGTIGSLILRLATRFPIAKIILVGRNQQRLEEAAKITNLETELLVLPSSLEPDSQSVTAPLMAMASKGIDIIIDLLKVPQYTAHIARALRVGGTFVHLGGSPTPFPTPLIVIMQMCWTITGCRTNGTLETKQVLQWLADGSLVIDDLITHRFKFSQVLAAFDVVEERKEPMWLNVVELA
ncbi:theronine dehydrogenase [Cadophora sp. MPI-SDFR-AT-0126]|nr:theronine dehydrogenase [Leotiomycetes sp. MPI-SDFR-AT-0126]